MPALRYFAAVLGTSLQATGSQWMGGSSSTDLCIKVLDFSQSSMLAVTIIPMQDAVIRLCHRQCGNATQREILQKMTRPPRMSLLTFSERSRSASLVSLRFAGKSLR